MDTTSLLIGLAIVLLCAIPLVKMAKAQSKTKNKSLDIFKRFHINKSDYTETDMHYKKMYALDGKNKGFVFADLEKGTHEAHFVNLNEVSACVVEEIRTGENTQLIMKFSGINPINVVLYDLEADKLGKAYWEENEQIAQKWEKLVSDCIKK